MSELLAIASSEENVRLLEDFDVIEFSGLRSEITTEACFGEYIDSLLCRFIVV